MILFLSLKSFFSANKILSVAFSVLMVVCLAGGLFGVNYVYCNVDFYNEYVSTQKNYTLYNTGTDVIEPVSALLEKYADKIAYAIAFHTDLYTNEEGESEEIETQALIYVSEDYFPAVAAAYGRMLTADELKNGEKKIILEYTLAADWIGKTVTVFGEDYEVVGLAGTGSQYKYMIPFFSLRDGRAIERIQIVLTAPFGTKAEKQAFYDDLCAIFPRLRIDAPDNEDTKSIFDYAPMLLPTAILIVLGFINLGFLYVYFIKMRKMQYSVFRIGGASVPRIFVLYLGEVLLLYTAAFIVAAAVFKIIMALFFSAPASVVVAEIVGASVYDCMSFLRCLGVYFLLAVLLAVAFLPSLIKTLLSDVAAYGGN